MKCLLNGPVLLAILGSIIHCEGAIEVDQDDNNFKVRSAIYKNDNNLKDYRQLDYGLSNEEPFNVGSLIAAKRYKRYTQASARGNIRLTKEEQKEGVCGFAATGSYLPKWQNQPYRSRIEKSNIWNSGDKRIREICNIDEVYRPESTDPMYITFKEYLLENYRYTIEESGFDEACSVSEIQVLDDMDEIEPPPPILPLVLPPILPCCCTTDLDHGGSTLSDLRSRQSRIMEPFLRFLRSGIFRRRDTTTPDPNLPCCCISDRETRRRI